MTSFWALAIIMMVISCALVVLPLMWHSSDSSAVSRALARASMVAVIVILPLAALNLYKTFSNWNWQPPTASAPDASVAEMVAGLEQRLAAEGGNAQEWHMLARSYLVMERVAESVQAFERAHDLSGGRNAEIKLDFADALLTADPTSVTGRAGDLVEEAVLLDPEGRRSLWYGGSVAYQRGQYAAAIARWEKLLNGQPAPPESMQRILAESLQSARANLPGASRAVAGATSEAPAQPTSGDRSVNVDIALSPSLQAAVVAGAPLFVIARPMGQQGGPPVAVQRHTAGQLPLSVTLSDADAMLPGRQLSAFSQVEIVARVALGGGPVASPGDLYGSVNYNTGTDGAVTVLIDKVQQ